MKNINKLITLFPYQEKLVGKRKFYQYVVILLINQHLIEYLIF